MIGKAVSLTLAAALFVGAVLAAGSTVSSSYHFAQLEQRELAALNRQRVLKEELAQAGSLQPVLGYAQAHGFTRTGELGSVRLGAALAQR